MNFNKMLIQNVVSSKRLYNSSSGCAAANHRRELEEDESDDDDVISTLGAEMSRTYAASEALMSYRHAHHGHHRASVCTDDHPLRLDDDDEDRDEDRTYTDLTHGECRHFHSVGSGMGRCCVPDEFDRRFVTSGVRHRSIIDNPSECLIRDLNALRDILVSNNRAHRQFNNGGTAGSGLKQAGGTSRKRGILSRGLSSSEMEPDVTLGSAGMVTSVSGMTSLQADYAINDNSERILDRDERLSKKKGVVGVELRVVFLKIGEIDTLKEIYHAEIFIQAKWREPRLDGRTQEDLLVQDLDKCWSPLLYIDNILTDTKDQFWLTAEVNNRGQAFLVERRRLKGVFLETLELNDFPLDVQDLTITMTSERPTTEVDILADKKEPSGINLQTFVDQQEWRLHEHVEITRMDVTPDYTSSAKCHPCFSVTCRAARRPGYFYWNVFLIMFFITGLSFATFSVPHYRPENRLQLSFTLFLTSVAFKFVINQSLPKISYLTYMDKYVLMSLAILCIVSIWHAFVTLIPDTRPNRRVSSPTSSASSSSTSNLVTPLPTRHQPPSSESSKILQSQLNRPTAGPSRPDTSNSEDLLAARRQWASRIEQDVFISFCALYILAHLIFIFWLYFDASRRRREMFEKDRLFKLEKMCVDV